MPPPYTSYAALAAEHVEGVDYRRVQATPAGWSWLSSAVHGGAIEAGTSEIAQYVAGNRMAYYAFEGIMASNNSDLHITSTLIDYPDLLAMAPGARRWLSFHGMADRTPGVAEVAVGGLDGQLAAAVTTALTNAGFSCAAPASEIAGTDPNNICSRGLTRAGVQLELSNALRASFFPGGDLSRANRESGARTSTFYAFGNALKSLQFLIPTFNAAASTVHISGNPVGIYETFTRSVSGGWGTTDSGHTWTTSGGSTSDFSVSGSQALAAVNSVNISRWGTLPTGQADFDVTASFATDKLAVGGSQFCSLAGRHTDVDNTYLARLEFTTTQVVNLTIRKRVGGTETLIGSTINTGLTHAAGTRFVVRFRGSGSTLQAKVWLASGSEPGTWTDTVTDTSITTGYRVGARAILSSSNTNTLPVTYSIDDFKTLGTTSLQHSTDGGTTWGILNGSVPAPPTALSQDDVTPTGGVSNLYRIQQLDATSGAVLMEGDQESITPAVATAGMTISASAQNVFPPRVLVSVAGMTSSNIASVTLYRQIGTDRTAVRASTEVPVTGQDALLRVDGEEPFGTPLTYVAALTDAIGSRAELTSVPLTCTVDSDVISDAIRGVGAAVKIEAPLGWKRDRDSTSFNINGRIVVVGRPRSAKSATVTVRTETDEAGDALNEVLDGATEGTILIRKQQALPRLDGTYALIDDQEDPNWYDEYRWFQLNVVQSDDWPDTMEASGYTLQDIADNFTTLQDIADAFPGTLLDIALFDFGT
ncbi:poly-gamma-glutamate hydrolase family protein [Streptomyces sp. NPDC007251]|uniref:poly-gamma-glutamate hydrolase family protein n=1 Tax=Streptomyces sp. NPDC007251 TaxID=3154483 RepID=UPI0033FAE7F9